MAADDGRDGARPSNGNFDESNSQGPRLIHRFTARATRAITIVTICVAVAGARAAAQAPYEYPPPGAIGVTPVGAPGGDETIGAGVVVSDGGAVVVEQPYPCSSTPIVGDPPFSAVFLDRRLRAVYVRLEAFNWHETLDGMDFVDESGFLATVGIEQRSECLRYRLEFFGGRMDYEGHAQYDYYVYPYEQDRGTGYFGGRMELEYLVEPLTWPRTTFVLGIGTRFWRRRLYDGELPSGDLVLGYDENWWTIYPYLGIETRDPPVIGRRLRLFGAARLGLTAFTREDVSIGLTLYPRCDLLSQFEVGFRNDRFSVSLVAEAMGWGQSPVVDDFLQPDSVMSTLGLRFAYRF